METAIGISASQPNVVELAIFGALGATLRESARNKSDVIRSYIIGRTMLLPIRLQLKPTRLLLAALFACVSGSRAEEIVSQPPTPSVHHILLEVSDLKASIAFYRDLMDLHLKSQSGDFVTLEAANVGVYLWSKRWEWEAPRASAERQGLGMYPHFEVAEVAAMVSRALKAGYRIVQEPRTYEWGTEAFIADPDGYIWALVSLPK
jgi:catechol 2,3-dioxygenase-like lactoylglutathione lyase family enzyme